MGGLAYLDRPLDPVQHRLREHPPQSPAMFDQVLADALDAHIHQLPDAPPPPKLPPPPENPLSLSRELEPPPRPPPPPQLVDHPPPPLAPPPRRVLRPASKLAARMLSANIVMKKAATPTMPDTASDPRINQVNPPITPAVAVEPSSRPRSPRSIVAMAT